MNKIDKTKFFDQLISIGIFLPEIAVSVLFTKYPGDRSSKTLDIPAFLNALANSDSLDNDDDDDRSRKLIRKEVESFKGSKNMCEISRKILSEYDER